MIYIPKDHDHIVCIFSPSTIIMKKSENLQDDSVALSFMGVDGNLSTHKPSDEFVPDIVFNFKSLEDIDILIKSLEICKKELKK